MRISKRYTALYSGVQAAYWMAVCAGSGFVSVFLLAQGYKNAEIGTVLALANILASALQPAVAGLCDRQRRLRMQDVIVALSALLILLMLGIALDPKRQLILSALMVPAVALLSLLQPLINVLGTKYEPIGIYVDYGVSRACGSLAYALLVAALGALIERYGAHILPPFAIALLLVLILFTLRYREPAAGARGETENEMVQANVQTAHATRFFDFVRQNPAYMGFVLAVTLIFCGQSLITNFSIQVMTNIGGGAAELGVALLITATMEIPTMIASMRLKNRFGSRKLLCVSACFFLVKGIVIALARSVFVYDLAQLLQIGGYALFIPMSVLFAAEVMQPADAAKAQAFVTMGCTLGAIFASLAGGWLLDAYGVNCMMLVSVIVSAAGVLLMLYAVPRVPNRNEAKPGGGDY